MLPSSSGPARGVGVSTAVARKAAATCLERQQLTNTILTNLFNVDMEKMSMYVSGMTTSLEAPPEGYHWDWSDEARKEAEKIGWKRQTDADAAMRRIERSEPSWAKPFRTPEDSKAEGVMILMETLIDIGVGYGAAQKARNDPSSVGVPPDRVVPNDATPEKPPAEKEKPPAEKEKPPTEKEKPPAEKEKPSAEKDKPPAEKEKPHHDEPELVSTNVFHGDINDVDLTDDITATPAMQDETTRTAMQRCHESVEAELWEDIGSTTTNPNTKTPEDAKAEAEHLMTIGICDNDYYGRKACKEWKKKQVKVPLGPEEQADIDFLKQQSVCPPNLIALSDCNKAKQQFFMRFVTTEVLNGPITDIFRPGKAIPWLPRLDLHLSGSGGGLSPAVAPTLKTKEEVPDLFSSDGTFKFLTPSKLDPWFGPGSEAIPGHRRPGHAPIDFPGSGSDNPFEISNGVGPITVNPFHVDPDTDPPRVGGLFKNHFPEVPRDEL